MARCLAGFEQLDAARQDTLLCNVLYSGVWQRYRALHAAPASKAVREARLSFFLPHGPRR